MLAQCLEHLVQGIVDFPEDVKVFSEISKRGEVLQVQVNREDLGRIIGKSGRTIRALRKIIFALAQGNYIRVELVDVA